MAAGVKGRLYGINYSNRSDADLWGKNQFNSTFPAALSCYMRDEKKKAVYLSIGRGGKFSNTALSFDKVFGTTKLNSDLFFNFEGRFDRYADIIYGPLERVDVIVSNAKKSKDGKLVEGKQLRALEVKLTVVPDNSSCEKDEKEWGPEIVVRPATTKYCAISMADGCKGKQSAVRKIFDKEFSSVKDWGNEVEALTILPEALVCLRRFEREFSKTQIPLVLQPIWKTEGKSAILAEKAFDVFVWSNFALARLIVEQAEKSVGKKKISRPARSALRLARFLHEFGKSGKGHINNIYDEMTFGYQNDKDFAVNGGVTRSYMTDQRIYRPAMSRDVVEKIILDGGIKFLSPERRFDQSIYFLFSYE